MPNKPKPDKQPQQDAPRIPDSPERIARAIAVKPRPKPNTI